MKGSDLISNIDIVELMTLIVAIIALVYARIQLIDFRRQQRVLFTYSLYTQFFEFLNKGENADLKLWLFGLNELPYKDDVKIGDLLEHFEAIWSLQKRKLIDDEIAYDLFSYYIIKASKARMPTVEVYLKELKEIEKVNLGYREDLFEGYLELLSQMNEHEFNKYSSH